MVSFSLGIYFSFSVSGLCLFSKVVSLRSLTDKQTLPRKNRKYLLQKAVRWWSELFQMQSLHTQPNLLSPAVKRVSELIHLRQTGMHTNHKISLLCY